MLLYLLCFATTFLFGQENKINPNSILFGKANIPLYKRNNGMDIKEILKRADSDDYFEAEIIQKKDKRFYIKTMDMYTDTVFLGWVDKRYVGVGLRNKSVHSIPIYEFPRFNSKKTIIKINIMSVTAEVLNINGNWLKICFNKNGKKIIGWLAPDNQCYNLYTMCSG